MRACTFTSKTPRREHHLGLVQAKDQRFFHQERATGLDDLQCRFEMALIGQAEAHQIGAFLMEHLPDVEVITCAKLFRTCPGALQRPPDHRTKIDVGAFGEDTGMLQAPAACADQRYLYLSPLAHGSITTLPVAPRKKSSKAA